MTMPRDLVLVRHGQSEGNVATDASKVGDDSWYTDTFISTPGHQWRLTDTGRAQAAVAGAWLTAEFGDSDTAADPIFDAHFVSPYVRTMETAGNLALPGATWRKNRALRERDWGDIGQVPKRQFESAKHYRRNALMKKNDPLYWVPPGGESIAQVAEDRVRNVLDTLHREHTDRRVIAVTHGEAMWAFRLVLERLDDETFVALDGDKVEKIHNCEVLHYTRVDPDTGQLASKLQWLRRARPVMVHQTWQMLVGDWRRLQFRTYTNDDLLAAAARVPSLRPTTVPA